MKINKQYVILIVLLIILGVGFFINKANETEIEVQVPRVSENEEVTNKDLQEVNFCGKVYYTNRLEIDGVDIIQRLAEIDKHGDLTTCSNLSSGIQGDDLRSSVKQLENGNYVIVLFDLSRSESEGLQDEFYKSSHIYVIGKDGAIYISSPFDGSLTEIGALYQKNETTLREYIDQTKLKTYVNEQYGFSFDYPESLYLYDEALEEYGVLSVSVFSPDNLRNKTDLGFSARLRTYIKTKEETQDFLNTLQESAYVSSIVEKSLIVDGKNISTVWHVGPHGVSFLNIFIELNDGYVARINHVSPTRYDDIFSNIVSSFRLIK